ncbi:sensor domain-containing diguanylate cyclase [Pseudoneobacillus sp. C159]
MRFKRNTIQTLFMALMLFSIIGTFIGSLYSSIVVSKENLEKNYLIENQYYAEKLASTTNSLFMNMIRTLKVQAAVLSDDSLTINYQALHKNLNQLMDSTDYFNSLLFVTNKGLVATTVPHLGLEGKRLTSLGATESLKRKVPYISSPYLGVTGRLLVLVSFPVFNDDGIYKGFLAGTIYLNEDNSLKKTLGEHPKHLKNSYVYVVDSNGTIIYHPDSDQINKNARENKVVQKLIEGKSGQEEVINTKGIAMLAGYASVKRSHWGIVSQTPKDSVSGPTYDMAIQVAKYTIPFMMFVFLLALLLLKKIVQPLRKLADFSHQIIEKQSIPLPSIPETFFELTELKKSMFIMVEFYKKQIHYFENEATLDPLTGLNNRRSYNKTVKELNDYSLLLLDIDHFKLVNDEFGHLKGDDVLKLLAEILKKETRKDDLLYRFGGEEFIVILPNTEPKIAFQIAENIRRATEESENPIGRPITVSMGIGHLPTNSSHHTELFHLVDMALYKAKNEGRNRVISADER